MTKHNVGVPEYKVIALKELRGLPFPCWLRPGNRRLYLEWCPVVQECLRECLWDRGIFKLDQLEGLGQEQRAWALYEYYAEDCDWIGKDTRQCARRRWLEKQAAVKA